MTVQYPLSSPVLLQNIPRSTEERSTLCNMYIELAPLVSQGILGVLFKEEGRYYPISRSCNSAFRAVHSQWLKYIEIVTKYTVELDRGCVNPMEVQLYASMVAYLKDVMVAFMEETEASGDDRLVGLQRSARLDFHYALAISGAKFTESNYRKMGKMFNVKWTDFLTGVNIPALAKLTSPSTFHALLCGDDENFCGFTSVKHSDASLTMIDRYIGNSVTAWRASNDSTSHGKALPDPGPAGKGKAKQVNDGESDKGDYLRGIRSTQPATRSKKLTIKLPALASRQYKKGEDTVKGTRASTRQRKAPIDVDIEDVPSQSMFSMEGKAQTMQTLRNTTQDTVERFGSLAISIEKDETVGARPSVVGASQTKTTSVEAGQPYVQKDRKAKSRTRVQKGGTKRQSEMSILRASPVQPESEEGGKTDDSIDVCVQETPHMTQEEVAQKDGNMHTASDNVIKQIPTPSDQELLRRAMLFADGTTVTNNMLIWLIREYRTISGIPLDQDFNGRLIARSPEESSFAMRDEYLEALGIERFYVALTHMHDSPHHLVHLFHALGKAALETNLLSDSSSIIDAVDPLPWLTSTQLKGFKNDDMVTPVDEDVKSLHGDEAMCEDGPELAADAVVIDEDIYYSTEKGAKSVRFNQLPVSTNRGTIEDLERLCEDAEGEGKRKRAESHGTSPPQAEAGRGPSKRPKRAIDSGSIGKSTPLVGRTRGPANIHVSKQALTGPNASTTTKAAIATFGQASQSIPDKLSTNRPKDNLRAARDMKLSQSEVSKSSLPVQEIVNATKSQPLPVTVGARMSGISHGGAPCGPTDAETKAWFELWDERD